MPSIWSNDAHEDLAVAIADVLGPILLGQQQPIAQKMNAKGHNVTWESIR
jgi:hypothetical protein